MCSAIFESFRSNDVVIKCKTIFLSSTFEDVANELSWLRSLKIREKIIASVLSSNAPAILDSEFYKSRIIKTCWLLSIWVQIVRDGSCLMHLNRVCIIDPISRSPFLPSWNLHKVELFSTFISHLGDISSRKCSRKCKFLWKEKKKFEYEQQ